MIKISLSLTILSLSLTGFAQLSRTIDHTTCDIHQIPTNWIDSAKTNLDIVYWRASHGTQLTDGGMRALMRYTTEYEELYSFSEERGDGVLKLVEFQEDLEHQSDTWVATTEAYLASHPDVNTVMWAWCGIEGQDIDRYLANMETLIDKYGPGGSEGRLVPVTFVFMNAHTYPYPEIGEEVYNSNKQIKTNCETNYRWFYDFYDLECFDPDENYFGDGTPDHGPWNGEKRLRWDMSYNREEGGRGNWGIQWMAANPTDELSLLASDEICQSCEHSDGEDNDNNSRLHCVLKGQAAWWLWARLAGWQEDEVISAPGSTLYSKGPKIMVLGKKIRIIPPQGSPGWDNGTLRILSLTGAEILSSNLKQGPQEIEISQGTGIYLLVLQSNDTIRYRKVFIQ